MLSFFFRSNMYFHTFLNEKWQAKKKNNFTTKYIKKRYTIKRTQTTYSDYGFYGWRMFTAFNRSQDNF